MTSRAISDLRQRVGQLKKQIKDSQSRSTRHRAGLADERAKRKAYTDKIKQHEKIIADIEKVSGFSSRYRDGAVDKIVQKKEDA